MEDILSRLNVVNIFYVDVQQKVRLLSDSTEGPKARAINYHSCLQKNALLLSDQYGIMMIYRKCVYDGG